MELDLDEEEEEVDDESRSDGDASLEDLTETEEVEEPPTNRRDPRERYMERLDGH